MIIEDNRLVSWYDKDKMVVIPENITTIGKNAFLNNVNIIQITIPSSVITISDNAFMSCEYLETIVLEEGVKRLKSNAFAGCKSLKNAFLPDTVVSLHSGVFQDCTGLEKVILSKNLRRNIEKQTFAGCCNLKSVVIPCGINRICSLAFSGCTSLKTVVFENEDVTIDKNAFENCPNLSDDVCEFIESHTFEDGTIDIRSKASAEAGRLSNFTQRHFVFDNIECNSIEGVLQSFKCPDKERQKEICLLYGKEAKLAGQDYDWTYNQTLYWNEVEYPRKSKEYQNLLDRLYDTVYEQNEQFKADLEFLRDKKFDHRMGLTDKSKTVLTRSEFVQRLRKLSRY